MNRMVERDRFLESTDVVDWKHPDVLSLAGNLADRARSPEQIAKRCFVWVRDEIKHSRDFGLTPVPCSASEVIECGSGYCYAKSHLLAALLRANGIPVGFCYQRLSRDEGCAPYCLHGLNAVFLKNSGGIELIREGIGKESMHSFRLQLRNWLSRRVCPVKRICSMFYPNHYR